MKHLLCLLSLSILACTEAMAQIAFTINGTAQGVRDSTIIYLINNDEQIKDSTRLIQGKFQFTGKTGKLPASFIIHQGLHGADTQLKSFWIDGEVTTIQISGGDFKHAVIKGSKTQDDEDKLLIKRLPIADKLADIRKRLYDASKSNDTSLVIELKKEQSLLSDQLSNIDIRFVQENPKSFESLYLLSFLVREMSTDDGSRLFENLDGELKESEKGRLIRSYLDVANVHYNLNEYPDDFTLPNLNGQEIALSSFKGKYLLVNFWASWCGPCHTETDSFLLPLYAKYNKKGFEILGINFDTNKDLWRRTVEDEKIGWTTVSDLKAYDGRIAQIFKPDGMPYNLLLDPDGKIISMNPRGERIESELLKFLQGR